MGQNLLKKNVWHLFNLFYLKKIFLTDNSILKYQTCLNYFLKKVLPFAYLLNLYDNYLLSINNISIYFFLENNNM